MATITATATQVNTDRWATSLKQFTCDSCGDPIWAGNPHWVFYVKAGRNDRTQMVCWRCITADRGEFDGKV